jgi:hypothetical protein
MPSLNGATIGIFLGGALLSGVLLIAAHVGLYQWRDSLHRVANYTIGVACLLIGFTVSCGLLDAWVFAVGAWIVAGVGGAVIALAWWVRGLQKPGKLAAARAALEGTHGAARESIDRRN